MIPSCAFDLFLNEKRGHMCIKRTVGFLPLTTDSGPHPAPTAFQRRTRASFVREKRERALHSHTHTHTERREKNKPDSCP